MIVYTRSLGLSKNTRKKPFKNMLAYLDRSTFPFVQNSIFDPVECREFSLSFINYGQYRLLFTLTNHEL